MPRKVFERDIQRLKDDVLTLASIVEMALTDSVKALQDRDKNQSYQIVVADRDINKKRFAIESDALALIATQQPMARDLRVLAALFEIGTELERIGDYAKGIARINLMMEGEGLIISLVEIQLMAVKARAMLHDSLEAFINEDVELARAIPKRDDEVDALYNTVYKNLLKLMFENVHNTDQATYLLWVAHNLERAADRVTNICERVIFTVTGELVELDDVEQMLEYYHL